MVGAGDGETVTVVRPPQLDRFGDPVPGSTPEFDVPGCLFAPGKSQEQLFGANTVDTDGAIYAPAGSDFRAADKVRIRGEMFSVVGKPRLWGSEGVVGAVRQVTG